MPFGTKGALRFTGVCGVAHKGKQSCEWHSSTLFLNLDTTGYTATAGYTATQSDVTQSLPIGTAGCTTGQQDTGLSYRIRGWTTGNTAKQDTWTHHGSSTLIQQQGRETDL